MARNRLGGQVARIDSHGMGVMTRDARTHFRKNTESKPDIADVRHMIIGTGAVGDDGRKQKRECPVLCPRDVDLAGKGESSPNHIFRHFFFPFLAVFPGLLFSVSI